MAACRMTAPSCKAGGGVLMVVTLRSVVLRHNLLLYPLILRSIAERDASRRIEATAGPSWFETARYGKCGVWCERAPPRKKLLDRGVRRPPRLVGFGR